MLVVVHIYYHCPCWNDEENGHSGIMCYKPIGFAASQVSGGATAPSTLCMQLSQNRRSTPCFGCSGSKAFIVKLFPTGWNRQRWVESVESGGVVYMHVTFMYMSILCQYMSILCQYVCAYACYVFKDSCIHAYVFVYVWMIYVCLYVRTYAGMWITYVHSTYTL